MLFRSIDSDIKDTNQGKGEPDVTVNGNKLRMVQATDGNWYGYFADRDQAQRADAIQASIGVGGIGGGLDFGTFCINTNRWAGTTISFGQTQGVAFPFSQTTAGANFETTGNFNGGPITASCNGPVSGSISGNVTAGQTGSAMNVLRQAKNVNLGQVSATGVQVGQIGLNTTSVGADASLTRRSGVINSIWPFIQLYTFNPTGNIVVQYNKGGGVQSTTLTFDTTEQFATLASDRMSYPRSAQVDLTMTNPIMNIDPTDEDSWTFGTGGTTSTNQTLYYQIFNADGSLQATNKISKSLTANTTSLMFNHNDYLKLNTAAQGATVLNLQDNADQVLSSSGVINAGTQTITNQPVTFTETAPNTGVFGTYDENDVSELVTSSTAARGKSATLEFNQKSSSIVIALGSGTIALQPTDAEWNSGEKIPITLVDSDANKNSRSDEKLKIYDSSASLIPSLRIGTPFTLGLKGTDDANESTDRISGTIADSVYLANFTGTSGVNQDAGTTLAASQFVYTRANTKALGLGGAFEGNMTVQKYSDRALITTNKTASVTGILIDPKTTVADLKKSIFDPRSSSSFRGFNLVNLDIRGINTTITRADVYLVNSTLPILFRQTGVTGAEVEINSTSSAPNKKLIPIANEVGPQSLTLINTTNANTATVYSNIFGGSTGRGI